MHSKAVAPRNNFIGVNSKAGVRPSPDAAMCDERVAWMF